MGGQDKKQVVKIDADGLLKDDVTHYPAGEDHLRSYDEAATSLYKFKAPALLDVRNPHSYLLVGLLDGTGNDVEQDPLHSTNVAKFHEQVLELRRSVTANILGGAGHSDRKDREHARLGYRIHESGSFGENVREAG